MKAKFLVIVSFFLLFAFIVPINVDAVTRVKGYVKKNRTYVAPHYKTPPDSTKLNNYSTKGNINPFNGKKGTVKPFKISIPKRK